MNNLKIIIIVLLLIVLFFILLLFNQSQEKAKIYFGDLVLEAFVANSSLEKSRGLAGKNIRDNQAMIFIFNQPDYYAFWMKGVNYPIDIVWLDENLTIVDFITDLAPDSYPETFKSNRPALYVIETKAGILEKSGLKINDQIKIIGLD